MKPYYLVPFTVFAIFTVFAQNVDAQTGNNIISINDSPIISKNTSDIGNESIQFYSNVNPNSNSFFAVSSCSDTIKTGSFIVNLGITPQTFSNGLLPYGLIYDLITNYSVPIIWAINPSKVKDATDFTHNAIQYKGSSFIIAKNFISPAVQARITFWQSLGVVGAYSVGNFVPPIFDTITCFPKIMIDTEGGNQGLLTPYYANAGIPAGAYVTSTSATLGNCYDIWTAPHSDPTWATHNSLYNFVTLRKGWIFAACHSISVMESCQNTMFPFNNLKFLTTTGLQCFNAGSCNGVGSVHAGAPTAPFSYFYPSDPVMQFMGAMDQASQNGSEKWVIPLAGGQWRPLTRRGVTTSDGLSPQEGAEIAYGPAFSNAANGNVMYEGGHSFTGSGTIPDQVAAQRAYLNFIIWCGIKTRMQATMTAPATMNAGSANPVSIVISSGIAPYTYSWSSNIGGSFTSTTSSSTTYTPPFVPFDTTVVLKCVISDNCGRKNIKTVCVRINAVPNPLPVDLLSFTISNKKDHALLQWVTAGETNNDFFAIERSSDANYFDVIARVPGYGNSSSLREYQYNDLNPLPGISYYRLAQNDFDGKVNYSGTVFLDRRYSEKNVQHIYVTPSPVTDDLYLGFFSLEETNVTVRFYDQLGKLIYDNNLAIQKGENLIKCCDNLELSSGLFFVNITLPDGKSFAGKFIKK